MLRGNDARKKCQSIQLAYVPEKRGKADLTSYRQAGAEVINILSRFTSCIERASIDEAYLDITEAALERVKSLEFSTVQPCELPATHIAGKPRQSHDPQAKSWNATDEVDVADVEEDLHPFLVNTSVGGSVIGLPGHSDNPLPSASDTSDINSSLAHLNDHSDDCSSSSGLVAGRGGDASISDGHFINYPPPCVDSALDSVSYSALASDTDEILPLNEALEDEEDTNTFVDGDVDLKEKEESQLSNLSSWLSKEGNAGEVLLTMGAIVAKEMREAVFAETGFTCSAGISHNKVHIMAMPISPTFFGNHGNFVVPLVTMVTLSVVQVLAKLAAGMNKPNQQTILPWSRVETVFSTTPVGKV